MKTDKTFLAESKSILHTKGYNKEFYPLEELARSVKYNQENTMRKIRVYKWSGFFLLTAIPLISAFLSVAIKADELSSVIFPLSLILTLMTVLNAIFRPGERFQHVCLIGIKIDSFKTYFLTELMILEPINDSALATFINKKRKEFESHQKELIGLFMPVEKK